MSGPGLYPSLPGAHLFQYVQEDLGGWAPETAYARSMTKKGTPVAPNACACSMSALTASR